MLSPRWRKVVRDLWGYKARTLLVVLSVAVGVFAVGVIGTSRIVMSGDLHRIWMAFHPPSACLL
ncbi:MAG: hypothetical protein DIU69_11480 [Bacillota bacterium]|nr:MAG: hypothetical protein DIU69_11480 [Bacillota bacterium]